MSNKKKAKPCFAVASITKREVEAMKALYIGEATPYQQRLVLMVIVNKLSRAQDLLYIPESFDETAFVNGRAFVGQKILKYIKMPIGKLDILEEEQTDELPN